MPSTTQYLLLSPFTPKYKIINSYLNVTTSVNVVDFDARTLSKIIPPGARAYVKNVTWNGNELESTCHFDFYDVFRTGGELVMWMTSDKTAVDKCRGSLPGSLSTGGFNTAR